MYLSDKTNLDTNDRDYKVFEYLNELFDKGGFTYTRITANQHNRPLHDPASECPVQLFDASRIAASSLSGYL